MKIGEKQGPQVGKRRATTQGKAKEKVKIFDIRDMVQKSIVQNQKSEEVSTSNFSDFHLSDLGLPIFDFRMLKSTKRHAHLSLFIIMIFN